MDRDRRHGLIGHFNLLWGGFACLLIMGLIIIVGPYGNGIVFAPDQGYSWYYWKLPDPDWVTRMAAWGFYSAHQLFLWTLIARSQRAKSRGELGYSNSLQAINLIALLGNAGFVVLHIIQTRIWYDGLAQDVAIWSSQFSVIFLLVAVLIMENPRRGLVFGKKAPLSSRAVGFLRQYHGYYFSWAIIYTFWFHPIETTPEHLLGTFYTLLLLLQGSLFFTRFHTNRYWTVVLETLVVIHGGIVAWLSNIDGTVSMFLFGFLMVFLVTQMHGLGWTKQRRVFVAAAILMATLLYYLLNPLDILVLYRVPGTLYILVFLVTLVLAGILRLYDKKILSE